MEKADRNFIAQGVAAWVPMPFIIVLNEAFRDKVLVPLMGISWALPLSGVILIILLYICAYFFLRLAAPPDDPGTGWVVGGFWVMLTVLFQVTLTVFWQHLPVDTYFETLSLEALLEGNLSIIVLAMLFIAPVFCAACKRRNT